MKKTQSIFLFLIMLATLIPIPSQTVEAQSEVTHADIQQGAASVNDTFLQTPYNSWVGENYGLADDIRVGTNNYGGTPYTARGLLRFDLSGIPFDAHVTAATLKLTMDTTTTAVQWHTLPAPVATGSAVMEVYAVRWDFAEWAHWDGANYGHGWVGGLGTHSNDGASVEPEMIGTVTLPANPVDGTVLEIPILETRAITAMIRSNHFGFLFKLQDSDELVGNMWSFYSSDATVEANRPMLSFDYEPDGALKPLPPMFECFVGQYLGGNWNCSPALLGIPRHPWTNQSTALTAGGGTALPANMEALTFDCYAFPRCVNDFPIYYRFTYDITWISQQNAIESPELELTFDIPGMPSIVLTKSCGEGLKTRFRCKGTFEGWILAENLPPNFPGPFLIGYKSRLVFGPVLVEAVPSWGYYLGVEPYDQDCADTYMVPEPVLHPINPTIELPLGALGVPADEQIMDTEIGHTYMVYLENIWNDGAEDHTDAQVSFDGETWMSWEDFKGTAICVDILPTNEGEPDYWIVYFTAVTETFYIRAADAPDAFSDNTTPMPPGNFSFTFGEALLIGEVDCASAFTYDPQEDWLFSVNLQSTFEGGVVNDAADEQHFQVGEWYALEVASGYWTEAENSETQRIDLEHFFETLAGLQYNNGLYADLAAGGQYVQCVNEDATLIYFQAPAELLNLRVNDQDENFANNTGALGINVYHTAYNRIAETCELSFSLDDLVRSDTVLAQQSNGKAFGISVGSALTNTNTQEENFLSSGLVPGAWYALETLGGPWGHLGEGKAPAPVHYSLAVAESEISANNASTPFGGISTIDESAWGDLATWPRAECNVETDQLGHRLVYFQVPVTEAMQFSLRVDDFADWQNNTGEMSWNLYRVRDLGPEDSGLCDYSYTQESKINTGPLTVRADAPNGAYISKEEAIGQPVGTYEPLDPDTFYAIELLGEDFQWYDGIGTEPRIDMELSLNNGTTWGDIPGAGELCTLVDGDNTIFFIHTPVTGEAQFKLRVNSTTWEDNASFMGYNVYLAEAGSSIVMDGCVTEGYTTTALGPYEWIPVADEMGIGMASTNASYAEIAGLVPGSRYIVEISRGPWFDGESTYEDGRDKEFYSAEVSSDNGTTWQPMNGNNPDITCWEYTPDMKYYKIEFTVQDGQVWRIRVADTESATFDDNTGNLAYTLKGLVLPADNPTQGGTFTLAGCNTPPAFPGMLELGDFLNLGNYLAEWFDYTVGSMVDFFAWCPENTDMVTMFADDIRAKEPFATYREMNGVLNDVSNEMDAYDWGNDTTEDYSLFNKTPAQSARMVEEYIFGPISDDSPWMGGEVIDFSEPAPTMYYDNCNIALTEYVGPYLGQGVCFASNWARNVGLMFYIQLMFDLAALFIVIKWVGDSLKTALYIAVGVNFGTK